MIHNNDIKISSGRSFTGRKVNAEYSPSSDPMYRHNCYIEALPKPLAVTDLKQRISRNPAYDESERELPPAERLQAVQRLCNVVVPLPNHFPLEQKLSRMLRNGYFARNPLPAEELRQMQSAYPDCDWDQVGYDATELGRSTAAGFCVYGPSGVGKSTLIDGLLRLYPQVIVHTQYNGQAFDQQQLVWLKLECPRGGSPKALCVNFFQTIDRIFGIDKAKHFIKSGRLSVDMLLPKMADLAAELGLGVLVIDEAQRLRSATPGDAKILMEFFVNLTNEFSVPIVWIGTYKALSLFSTDFATARRSAGQGDYFYNNFDNDKAWRYFVKSIWKYQWTNVVTELDDELCNTLYEESQGIADIAVKIMMFAQWKVIGSQNEKISSKLLRVAAKENLHAAGPILDALRRKDFKLLSEIEDIAPRQDLLDMALAQAQSRVVLSGTLNTIRNQNKLSRDAQSTAVSPYEKLTRMLCSLSYDDSIAAKCAKAACDRFPLDTDMKRVAEEAMRLAREEEDAKTEAAAAKAAKKPTSKKEIAATSLSGDIREIVKKAPKGSSPYEALQAVGIIKSALEFLPGGTDDAAFLPTAPPG